ncbi:MAG: glycosyltransferase family 4 protein [Longimicrobiales bacterium]
MSDRVRPRVLLIGPTPPPFHGVAVFTRMLLASPQLASRYELLHLDTADRRGLDNLGRLDAGNVARAVGDAARLAALLRRERPDLVYLPVSQNPWAYTRDALFIALARASGAGVVTHLHGSALRELHDAAGAPLRTLIRATTARLDAALVLSDRFRTLYDGLLPAERVHVAPPGVAEPLDRPAHADTRRADVRDVDAQRTDTLTVLYLGMLCEAKGVGDLLRAAARLREHRPRLRFVLAGEWVGEAERRLALDIVNRERLDAHVTFPGTVDNGAKTRLLRSADIVVLPSRQAEGLPLVLLEAMACARAVIATPQGAVGDAVVDGETGALTQPRRPAALAAALARMAGDVALRERLGRAGRARYAAAFTDAHAAEAVARAWDAVLLPEAVRAPARVRERARERAAVRA